MGYNRSSGGEGASEDQNYHRRQVDWRVGLVLFEVEGAVSEDRRRIVLVTRVIEG